MRIMALILAMVAVGAAAQSSSCTNALISMSPCLNYITGNSSSPSSSCCSQLANVVRSEPQCLCQVLNGGSSSLGLSINQTRALSVPSACNIQTQPTSRCNGECVCTWKTSKLIFLISSSKSFDLALTFCTNRNSLQLLRPPDPQPELLIPRMQFLQVHSPYFTVSDNSSIQVFRIVRHDFSTQAAALSVDTLRRNE